MIKRKNRTFIGVSGVILTVIGFISTVSLGLREKPNLAGLITASLFVIVGILLITYAFSD